MELREPTQHFAKVSTNAQSPQGKIAQNIPHEFVFPLLIVHKKSMLCFYKFKTEAMASQYFCRLLPGFKYLAKA